MSVTEAILWQRAKRYILPNGITTIYPSGTIQTVHVDHHSLVMCAHRAKLTNIPMEKDHLAHSMLGVTL